MALLGHRLKAWQAYIEHENRTDLSVGERTRERLAFMGITQRQVELIREAAPLLEPHKKEIVDQFYRHILAVDHLREIINKHSSVDRLRISMEKYLDMLLEANFTKEYVANRIKVGKVHCRINLTADWFMAAHHHMLQNLTTIVMLELRNKPEKMVETVLAIQKVAAYDQQLIVEAYMEEMFQGILYKVSDTLNYMTQLETTRKLIQGMDNLMDESHNVTSATQQMSASIEEVAAHSGQVAEQTEAGMQSVRESQVEIQQALKHILQVGQVYEQMAHRISDLQESIEQTYGVIESIRKITEQTNLLALNASIEAARAGEHGRGFAVVAQEIRKLAEHTKGETQQITDRLEGLQEAFQEMTRQMDETGSWVEQSVDGARQGEKALEAIVSTMQEINDSITQIAAMTQEQSASVTDIAERSANIYELGSRSQELAKETAQIIFDLSKQLDEHRLSLVSTNVKLSMMDIINMAKTDHLIWKWRVYNMLMGLERIDLDQVTSHDSCRLGKWYYGNLPDEVKQLPAYKALEAPHMDVHRLAKEAVIACQEGNLREAEQIFRKLEEASETVVDLLIEMEEELGRQRLV